MKKNAQNFKDLSSRVISSDLIYLESQEERERNEVGKKN